MSKIQQQLLKGECWNHFQTSGKVNPVGSDLGAAPKMYKKWGEKIKMKTFKNVYSNAKREIGKS